MPDTEISRLQELPAALVDDQDVLAIADISASETKKVKAIELTEGAIAALPNGSIDPNVLDWPSINAGAIDGSAIADRSLPGTKLELDTITAAEIAPNAIGASELANQAVDTASIQDSAVTGDKIAANSIDDSHIVAGGISIIADDSISNGKLQVNSVDTDNIVNEAVTNEKLAGDIEGDKLLPDAITDRELADDAVDTNAIQDLAVTGEKVATGTLDDSKISNLDGSKLNAGSVTADKLDAGAFSDGIELDGTVKHTNAVTPSSQNGITFDAQGHITSTGPLVPSDLPIATATTVGAVSVPVNSGLTVSGTGELDHTDLISPGTMSGITYDLHGHITGAVPLVGDDLPIASSTVRGAVIVTAENGNPLSVDGDGKITHNGVGLSPGTYVSVETDAYGHVVNGSAVLASNQLPGLDADQITTGQFPTARLEDGSVTMPKLADYSISFIQETQPAITADLHNGCLWFQESTAQLRMWNGNSFMSVGFGRLSQDNLRWGGTFDASTGLIVNLTDAGRTANLAVGDAIPAATDALGGLYLLCVTPGNNTAVTPGVTYDAGDWCLCINQAEGWIRIDTINAGGGGGATSLPDLLDVDNNLNPQNGDILIWNNAASQWESASEIDGGTF